jgi:integrase/recombinase XerD
LTSELTGLRCADVHWGASPHVRCLGQGRKERATPPLTRHAAQILREWLRESHGAGELPLFPSLRQGPLSRDAVAFLLDKYARITSERCPSLRNKTISPHVLRRTTAMRLLEAGADTATIALWLGYEGAETTLIYLHAHPELNERELARLAPSGTPIGRYRPPDKLLAFPEAL